MFKFSHYIPQSGRLLSLHVAFFFQCVKNLWPQKTLVGAHNWVKIIQQQQKVLIALKCLREQCELIGPLWKMRSGCSGQKGPERSSGPGFFSHRWRMRKEQAPFPALLQMAKFKTLCLQLIFVFSPLSANLQRFLFLTHTHTHSTHTRTLAAPVIDQKILESPSLSSISTSSSARIILPLQYVLDLPKLCNPLSFTTSRE